ncbi:MAG: hypothetical protein HRT58_13290 [Crocinitomicaceae bacterium]|nr:hypothetical protein [Flavobacteriales bacterium]NQZ36638.1 hypothetical protein [Crocinitomicaceae bacterium]
MTEKDSKEGTCDDSNEQPKNFLDDILANALSSTKKYDDTNSGIETKKCKNCGAARPAETDLKYCDYCSNEFY